MMGRRHAIAAVVIACCLVFAHDAAARPLPARPPSSSDEEVAMDVSAAAAPEGSASDDEMVLGAGKWLPLPVASALAGGLRFPAGVIPAAVGASMPWVVTGAPPALPAGMMPPYIGATRQEQLTLWASLFNPFQQVRARVPGAVESPAERVPAVASGRLERTTTMDDPAGEPKWGVFLGTPNNG